MLFVTSVQAQSRFKELIDRSQREPVAVTRRGRTVAYVVGHDMQALATVTQSRTDAARWYAQYRAEVLPPAMGLAAAALTDDDVTRLVDKLRLTCRDRHRRVDQRRHHTAISTGTCA